MPILPNQDVGTRLSPVQHIVRPAGGEPGQHVSAYVNQRTYESSIMIYDNNGTLNVNGSDINYI